MKPLPILILTAATALLVWPACSAATRGAIKRWMYETPGRAGWQAPDRVVAALGLRPGDRVADLGAGGGYFTFRLAEAVGTEGRVYAIDVDRSLLAYVEREAGKRGLSQIVPVLAPADGPGLGEATVDWIFLANVFHHLPDPARYFASARGVLRPGGRVAVVETAAGGFPPGHATPPEEIQAALEAGGYALVERFDWLERQSFQVFAPRTAASPSGG